MPRKISPRLKRALHVFETGELDLIVGKRRADDFNALRSLVALDADVEPDVRQRAFYALGRWGDPTVVPDLVAALPQLTEPERITAVDALGRLGTDEARRAIESCADDTSPDVRKFVVAALRRIGGAESRAPLRKMAAKDKEQWVRSLARQALDVRDQC